MNEWKKFYAANPEFSKEDKKAREILMLLQDKYDVIYEADVKSMWKNIEQFVRD